MFLVDDSQDEMVGRVMASLLGALVVQVVLRCIAWMVLGVPTERDLNDIFRAVAQNSDPERSGARHSHTL